MLRVEPMEPVVHDPLRCVRLASVNEEEPTAVRVAEELARLFEVATRDFQPSTTHLQNVLTVLALVEWVGRSEVLLRLIVLSLVQQVEATIPKEVALHGVLEVRALARSLHRLLCVFGEHAKEFDETALEPVASFFPVLELEARIAGGVICLDPLASVDELTDAFECVLHFRVPLFL